MNHVVDADPGIHPMSPYYNSENDYKDHINYKCCDGCNKEFNIEYMIPDIYHANHTGFYFCKKCWTEGKIEEYFLLLKDIEKMKMTPRLKRIKEFILNRIDVLKLTNINKRYKKK